MSEPVLQPRTEGIVGGTTVDARGFIPKYEFQVKGAESLHALTEEYAFFTPAILYLRGRFQDAPLADFLHLVCPDAKFCYRKFSVPLFKGLETVSGNPDWNFVLWAMSLAHWDQFCDWMLSLSLTYTDTQNIARIGLQEVTVIDPVAYQRGLLFQANLPTLSVAAFGLSTNLFQAGLTAGTDPLHDPPELLLVPPTTEMQVFADALYGGTNPLDAVATHRQQKERPDASEV